VQPVHTFKSPGNTEALRQYFRDRALAELRAAGRPAPKRSAGGLQAYIHHRDGRVDDVTPGRPRTSTRAAKAAPSVEEMRAQLRAILYNASPSGRARRKVEEMERRTLVDRQRAVFIDILSRRRR